MRSRILGGNAPRQPEAVSAPAARVDAIRTQTRGRVHGLLERTIDISMRGARTLSQSFVVRNSVAPLLAANTQRVASAAEAVRTQRNAQPEALRKYHAGLLHLPGQAELPGHVFEYMPGTAQGPRKLVVLVLGNRQRLSMQDTGMHDLRRRFGANGDTDVLLCRSGNATRDVRNAISANADTNDTTEVTMAHIENIVHARANRTGMFADQPPVDRIAMAGFSFGGGVIERLSQAWPSMGIAAPVRSVALLDPIRHGVQHMGAPVTERPAFAERVFHAYQTSNVSRKGRAGTSGRRVPSVHGAPLSNPRPGDSVRLIAGGGHRELQTPGAHSADVLDPAYAFLRDSLA